MFTNHIQVTERRLGLQTAEVEELRQAVESAERSRKQAETELIESNERSTMLHVQNSALINQKKKIEASLAGFKVEAEEAMIAAIEGEEKAKQALTDAAIMSEELKKEQDQGNHLQRMKKNMETNCKELQARLDEAEQILLKGGKRMVMKMEAKVRDLEGDLETEQRKTAEIIKQQRKQERRHKEIAYQSEEDKKSVQRLQEMSDKLQNKVKTYKLQSEEGEENASINLGRYRKIQHEVDEAQERAELAEANLQNLRVKSK